MSKAPPLTCRICGVSLLDPHNRDAVIDPCCYWCKMQELRGLVRGLAEVLENLQAHHCWSGCTGDADHDSMMMEVNTALSKLPPDLRAPAKASREEEAR